jgi:hypothetical protein
VGEWVEVEVSGTNTHRRRHQRHRPAILNPRRLLTILCLLLIRLRMITSASAGFISQHQRTCTHREKRGEKSCIFQCDVDLFIAALQFIYILQLIQH